MICGSMIIHRELLGKIIGLFAVQGMNYVAPVLILPLLMRALNVGEFGLYSIYISLGALIGTIADMGVSALATKTLIDLKEERQVAERVGSIVLAKVLVLAVMALGFVLVFLFNLIDLADFRRLGFSALFALGYIIAPNFYFLAYGRMREYSFAIAIGKVLLVSMVALGVVISAKVDFFIFSNAFSSLVSGILVLYVLGRSQAVKISRTSVVEARRFISSARRLGVANLATLVYTTTPIFVIGKVFGLEAAGLYGAADKIIGAIKGLQMPFVQAFLSEFIKRYSRNSPLSIKSINRMMLLSLLFGLLLLGLVAGVGDELLKLIGRSVYLDAYPFLVALSLMPALFLISNILGNYILQPSGNIRGYMESIIFGMSVYLLGGGLAVVLNNFYIVIGAVVLCEIVVCISMYFSVRASYD